MKLIPSRLTRELTSVSVGLLLAFIAITAPAVAQTHQHVYGNFCSTCMRAGTHNQLYDDGLHNDGTANDGVWGVDITVDQPAGQYSFHYSSYDTAVAMHDYPRNFICPPDMDAQLWTSGPGDVIHFRLGGEHTNSSGTIDMPGNWYPDYAMSSDHSTPPGAGILFRLNNALAPDGYWLLQAARHGTIWSSEWRVPDEFEYHGSLAGTYWVLAPPGPRFGFSYNAYCYYSYYDPPSRWSAEWGAPTLFEFDEATGQSRSTRLTPTSVRRSSWGNLKAHYR